MSLSLSAEKPEVPADADDGAWLERGAVPSPVVLGAFVAGSLEHCVADPENQPVDGVADEATHVEIRHHLRHAEPDGHYDDRKDRPEDDPVGDASAHAGRERNRRSAAGELETDTIIEAIHEGRRVVVTMTMLEEEYGVILRHDGSTYYCDTPTRLHRHESEAEMRTCIGRMGYSAESRA